MYLSNKKTIMFITGAFISHSYWEEWIIFFENKGYKTVAPPWLYKNESATILRQTHPNSKIASIHLNDLLDYYTEIIEKLPENPILIGHSYGSLVAQLLLQKELGSAVICVNSFPPGNLIRFNISFFKAIWNAYGLFTPANKSYLMSFKEWQSKFTSQMSFEDQKNTYEKLIIPESKLIIRDLFSKSGEIDFQKKHNPILFVAGSSDAFIPASLQYLNFKKYKNLHSITSYKEFQNSNHLISKQENWKSIAEYIANWLAKIT